MPKSGFESWLPSRLVVRSGCEHPFVRSPGYTRQQVAEAVARSKSYAEVLRHLGLRPAGGNHATLRRHVERWQISTDHFDPNVARCAASRRRATPLDEVMVEHSSYSRGHLKERLYAAGIKQPVCELCGQGPFWRGTEMSLVLDHINGVADDHRLENLRIVCPNCAATLDTHCGKNSALHASRVCRWCGETFRPQAAAQQFCSRACSSSRPRPDARKAERPPLSELAAQVEEEGFLATGRRYGVSDNAIRKWLRQAEVGER